MSHSAQQESWKEHSAAFTNDKTIFLDRRGQGLPASSWWAEANGRFYEDARAQAARMQTSYFGKTSASLIAPLRGPG